MYLSESLQNELDYFKKLHENFSIQLGSTNKRVSELTEEILFMLLSASLAMDVSEEEFFESITITDKYLTNKNEMLIDAYSLIDADDSKEKHLHVFQFKIYKDKDHAASPKEVLQFTELVNNAFVHPELYSENLKNEVIREIEEKINAFQSANRKNKVKFKCHYINNAIGISNANRKDFEILKRFEYDKETYGFGIQIYGLQEIEDLATEGKIKVGLETLQFEIDSHEAFRHENNKDKVELGLPKQVLIGVMNVNELIRLQNKYHRNQLYAENIRLYLGDRANVNKDIIQTITTEESQWFAYMNNGISIICDAMKIGNKSKFKISVDLENMQIINGCQTVNALYSAKYSPETKDNFKPSKVLVKIYEIDPKQENFKLSIIKATNNQNAVKTAALVANDPIQIEIQKKLSEIGYLYDRKGEAKLYTGDQRIISMITSALAYRAVYWFAAQQLRSGMGQSKVFKTEEYKKLFKSELLEPEFTDSFLNFCAEIIVSTILMEAVRSIISRDGEEVNKKLPIFKKSLYYLSGIVYASEKVKIDEIIAQYVQLLKEENPYRKDSTKIESNLKDIVEGQMENATNSLRSIYENKNLDTSDIDNLLKSSTFNSLYLNLPQIKLIRESQNY